MLYTESDLEKSMDKIETIHFHQVFIGIVLLYYRFCLHILSSHAVLSFGLDIGLLLYH